MNELVHSTSHSTPTAVGPIVVGLWGSASDAIPQTLESGGMSVQSVESMPNPIELRDIDCLVVDATTRSDQTEGLYNKLRDVHATQPIVFVIGQSVPGLANDLEQDQNAAYVQSTSSGVPPALLTATCTRLVRGAPSQVAKERIASESPYRVGSFGSYILWIVAGITYGIGDLVTTLYALLFVPGLGEGNLLVLSVLQSFGIPGFVGLKIIAFILAIRISMRGAGSNDRVAFYAPPIAVAAAGAVLTGWNLLLITNAMG